MLLDALLLVESPLQRAFDDGSLPREVFNATRAALEDGSVEGAVSLLAAHAGAPEWASKMLTELVKTGNVTTSGNVEAARLAVEGASGGAPETYTRLLLEFAIDAGVVNASGLPASVVAPLVPVIPPGVTPAHLLPVDIGATVPLVVDDDDPLIPQIEEVAINTIAAVVELEDE